MGTFKFGIQHLIAVVITFILALYAGFVTGESVNSAENQVAINKAYVEGAEDLNKVWLAATEDGETAPLPVNAKLIAVEMVRLQDSVK